MFERHQFGSSKAGGVNFRLLLYSPGVAFQGFRNLGRNIIADACLAHEGCLQQGMVVVPVY